MTKFEFDSEQDRILYADWHPPLLDKLFAHQIDLHHDLYELTHSHRRQHNGGSDIGSCNAWPSPPSRAPVWHLISEITGAKRFLEIGTALGYTTALMADAAGPNGHVDTIEIDPDHAAQATSQLEILGLADRVQVIQGDATKILSALTEQYDVVFADAGNEEISKHLTRLRHPKGVSANTIASLRNPLIQVLHDLQTTLADNDESDHPALATARATYRQTVSAALNNPPI